MYEFEYIDYDENGNICGTGTEDFSIERLKSLKIGGYEIKKDSGERTATGKIKWDLVKIARVRIAKADYNKGIKFWKKQFDGLKVISI